MAPLMVSEIQELLRGGNSTNINEREIRSDSQKLLIASIPDKNSQTEKLKGQTREQQRQSVIGLILACLKKVGMIVSPKTGRKEHWND